MTVATPITTVDTAAHPIAPDVPVPYRIVARHEESPDVVTLRVRRTYGPLPHFEAAQFSMIGVVGVGEAPVSISSAIDDTTAHAYTFRRTGAVTTALWSCSVGDVITVRGPFGRPWDLKRSVGRHALFVAGGIGLAPLCAAIDALAFGPSSETVDAPSGISVLVGASTPEQHMFQPWMRRLEAWGVDVRRAVDVANPATAWDGHVGFVTDLIADAIGDVGNTPIAAYACGPDQMMSATIAVLAGAGVAPVDIEVTLERNMQCGNGWCGHCQLGTLLVCRDGPVAGADELGVALEQEEL